MNIPVKDRSNYLKGLLIMAKKDNALSEAEKKLIRHRAKKLGFANDFYEETLQNLLSNQYILEEPIVFSNKQLAKAFISDGLKLIFSDDKITKNEFKWLKEIAKVNDIDDDWFNNQLENYRKNCSKFSMKADYSFFSLF